MQTEEALSSNIVPDKYLVTVCDEKLVGIMGIQTNKGGFIIMILLKFCKAVRYQNYFFDIKMK